MRFFHCSVEVVYFLWPCFSLSTFHLLALLADVRTDDARVTWNRLPIKNLRLIPCLFHLWSYLNSNGCFSVTQRLCTAMLKRRKWRECRKTWLLIPFRLKFSQSCKLSCSSLKFSTNYETSILGFKKQSWFFTKDTRDLCVKGNFLFVKICLLT